MNELEQATIVARAIHTLEVLRDAGIIRDDESAPALFVEQTWGDLRRLAEHYRAQGICPADVDLGGFINGDPGVYADFERARMAEWNAGRPISTAPRPVDGPRLIVAEEAA